MSWGVLRDIRLDVKHLFLVDHCLVKNQVHGRTTRRYSRWLNDLCDTIVDESSFTTIHVKRINSAVCICTFLDYLDSRKISTIILMLFGCRACVRIEVKFTSKFPAPPTSTRWLFGRVKIIAPCSPTSSVSAFVANKFLEHTCCITKSATQLFALVK